MTQQEIDIYRTQTDQQIKEKFADIDSNLSFVITGALGFFLTIDEKFVDFKHASLTCILILSIVFLFISFFLFFFVKSLTTTFGRKIIDFLDEGMKADTPQHDIDLLNIWKKFDFRTTVCRYFMYFFIFTGILLEIIFFSYNLMNTPIKNNDQKVKIEILTKDPSKISTLVIDSLK